MSTPRLRRLCLGAAALISCALLSACETVPLVTPARDPGGVLAERMAMVEALRLSGAPVHIRGRCLSACTLYLGLPNACLERDATLGFHGPWPVAGRAMSPAAFEAASERMASYYPPSVARRFIEEWRHRGPSDLALVPAAELIARGEARACPA